MDARLLKALILLVPTCLLCAWSVRSFARGKAFPVLLQLVGASALVVVALTHVFEALRLFAFMDWGSPHSVGHYLDFSSALLGVTLFPLGLVLHAVTKRRVHQ